MTGGPEDSVCVLLRPARLSDRPLPAAATAIAAAAAIHAFAGRLGLSDWGWEALVMGWLRMCCRRSAASALAAASSTSAARTGFQADNLPSSSFTAGLP